MCFHLFYCLALWNLQDAQKTSRLLPRPLPDVPSRSKWFRSCRQNLPQTSSGALKCVQSTPRPLPDFDRRFPRAPSRSRTIKKLWIFFPPPTHLHHGPRLEGQGQRSQVRGPGFMVGSKGPRRFCRHNNFSQPKVTINSVNSRLNGDTYLSRRDTYLSRRYKYSSRCDNYLLWRNTYVSRREKYLSKTTNT